VSHQPRNIHTDRQLVDLVLGGDMQAFSTIIKTTEGLVAQIVYKLISNEEDRKDMAQDIYLKVFHHLKGFKFQSKLSTWVGQIAYNTCLNRLQKKQVPLYVPPDGDWEWIERGRRYTAPGATEETDGVLLKKELNSLLQTAIGQLPPLYQTLIGLYHQEDLSYQEITQITGLPEGTVKNYLFRARKILKESLLSNYKKEQL
jgi:RNA polymerase sigma-70 factor (ECF subfamily)